MEEIGLDVDCVEDGTDAVNIMSSAEGRKYDLIFMDIQMPKMDGYTATREIRTLNDPKCANIPIIAMTANAFEEDRKKAIKAGMNAHIAKPISVDIILENLERMRQNRSILMNLLRRVKNFSAGFNLSKKLHAYCQKC